MDSALTNGKAGLWGAYDEVKKAEVPEEAVNVVQAQLMSLEDHEGWKNLKKMMQRQIDELLSLSDQLKGTESLEEVGYKYMASRQAAMYLEKFMTLPERQRRMSNAGKQ